ncbi:hypothetical protein FRX31_010414, partial [Thalictrum thalictroides]
SKHDSSTTTLPSSGSGESAALTVSDIAEQIHKLLNGPTAFAGIATQSPSVPLTEEADWDMP